MRNVSHKAAATIAIGILTDDLLGALLQAPAPKPLDEGRAAFAQYVAAGRWLGTINRSERPTARTQRPFDVRN